MHISRGSIPAFKDGEHPANTRREYHLATTGECSDWLKDTLNQQSAKEIAAKAGTGHRSAEAVKLGRNGLTMAHLVSMCRSDPAFRAQFFRFCGGILEGEPEMVAALSHAINEIMRQRT